jgi:hypothetical protein
MCSLYIIRSSVCTTSSHERYTRTSYWASMLVSLTMVRKDIAESEDTTDAGTAVTAGTFARGSLHCFSDVAF